MKPPAKEIFLKSPGPQDGPGFSGMESLSCPQNLQIKATILIANFSSLQTKMVRVNHALDLPTRRSGCGVLIPEPAHRRNLSRVVERNSSPTADRRVSNMAQFLAAKQ